MSREYYPLRYRLDGSDSFLIGYSDDPDGVVVGDDGAVPSFRAPSDLCAYAERQGLKIDAEASGQLDLDELESWLRSPAEPSIECRPFLEAWNLFEDVASSTGLGAFERASRKAIDLYDKLFWGSNLRSITPRGEHHMPDWSEAELIELRQVLSDGMATFRHATRAKGNP